MLGLDCNREHDPNIQKLSESLGVLLGLQGKHGEAEIVLSKVLDSKIEIHGEHHVESLRTRENLANCLRRLEKFDEAEQHYAFILQEHSTPWFSLRSNCALLYWARDHFLEAHNILSWLLNDSKSIYGDLHHETLATQHNVGTLCLEMGFYDKARLHLHQAFNGRKILFGWIHPQSLMSARNLAIAEIELEHYDEAEKLLKKALKKALKMTQLHHPQENDIYFDLVELKSMVAAGRGRLSQAR